MRLAVEAWAAEEVPAGRGRYVRELLRALVPMLRPEDEVVLLTRTPWDGLDADPRVRWLAVEGTGPAWIARAARAARARADVLLATTSYALPVLARMPSAAVVYDLVAFDRTLSPATGALLERATLPLAVRACGALLCISQATERELVTRFPRARRKAVVTPLAADDAFFAAEPDPAVTAKFGLQRPYVLSAATLEPRKNLPRLIESFALLSRETRDAHDLVLVGGRGWKTEDLDSSLKRHETLVRALGFVSDSELASLYAGASAVAYVSLQEGFGLPVLEAMAAGAPVLTSNVSSLPEVGGEAVLYATPTSEGEISRALEALLQDAELRERLSKDGRERARTFSWETTARQTLGVLRRLAREDPDVAPEDR